MREKQEEPQAIGRGTRAFKVPKWDTEIHMSSFVLLKKEANNLISSELRNRGFSRKKGYFRIDIAEEVQGTAALGTVSDAKHRYYAVNVSVGVRHTLVERLANSWRQDLGRAREEKCTPTTIFPLGNLLPQRSWKEWHFNLAEPSFPIATDIGDAVTQFGLPWMTRLRDIDALREWIVEHGEFDADSWYTIPAIYILMGESAKARMQVQKVVSEMERRNVERGWPSSFKHWISNYKEVMRSI